MSKKCSRCYEDNDYPVDIKTNIPPTQRWTDINTPAPPPQLNKGLYGGPPNNSPWMGKPVVPTTTYFMQVLLKSCDPPPPPGATEQYPTENRLGNNYTAQPGVNWFNSAYDERGPYNMKVIDPNFNKEKDNKEKDNKEKYNKNNSN